MTIESSLGSLDQQEQDDQEGMTIETAWDPSLDPSNAKPKKRVTFSKATLAAYNKHRQNKGNNKTKGRTLGAHSLNSLSTKRRTTRKDKMGEQDELPEKIDGAKLP